MLSTEQEIDDLLARTDWLTSKNGSRHTLLEGRHVAIQRRGAGWTWRWDQTWSREKFATEMESMRSAADYHLSIVTAGFLDTFSEVKPVGFRKERADQRLAWVFTG